jgi:serine/threonine protein phosphatase PrpC
MASACPPLDVVAVEAAGLTDVGQLRDSNEDAFLIATLRRAVTVHDASPPANGWFSGEPAGTLLAVADGMGGMEGGALASGTAVSAVADYLLNVVTWPKVSRAAAVSRTSISGLRQQLSTALVEADDRVKTKGILAGTPHMGTTLTMAFIQWPVMYVAHVGDTRCYLLQSGKLHQLTRDHNMAQKLADVAQHQTRAHEDMQHLLWNCLGAGDDQLPEPEVSKIVLTRGDAVLLCSDGLNKHVTDAQLERVLRGGNSCAARAAELVELANAAGGTDNVTAVVAQLQAA